MQVRYTPSVSARANLYISAILFFAFLATLGANAQDEPDVIATDRPDFTETAFVVKRGVFQLETGFTYQRSDGAYSFGGPEALLRYGVGKKFELRLGLPNYTNLRLNRRTTSGIGATYLGFKYQVGPLPGDVGVSLIPAVFAPTGGNDFNSGDWDPEIKLCLSKNINDRFTINGMLYALCPREDGRRNFTLQQTLSLSYGLGGRWGSFYEIVNTFPNRGETQHFYHAGITYLINNNTQLDVHLGVGLSRAAPDHLLAFGYSVRF